MGIFTKVAFEEGLSTFPCGDLGTRTTGRDVFEAVEGVIVPLLADKTTADGGFIRPLGMFHFVRQDLQPRRHVEAGGIGGLDVLASDLDAEFQVFWIATEDETVLGELRFELGVLIDPAGDLGGRGAELLIGRENPVSPFRVRHAGQLDFPAGIIVVGKFGEGEEGDRVGAEGREEGGAVGAGVESDEDGPGVGDVEIGERGHRWWCGLGDGVVEEFEDEEAEDGWPEGAFPRGGEDDEEKGEGVEDGIDGHDGISLRETFRRYRRWYLRLEKGQ